MNQYMYFAPIFLRNNLAGSTSSSWLPAPTPAPIDAGIHTPCSAWLVQCQAVGDGELSYPSSREAGNVCSMQPHPGWREKSWFFNVICCRKWHFGDWHAGDIGRISLPAVLPGVLWCGHWALWCSCVGYHWELLRVKCFPSQYWHTHFLNLFTWIPALLNTTKTQRSFLCFFALGKDGHQYFEAADVPEPIAWNLDWAPSLWRYLRSSLQWNNIPSSFSTAKREQINEGVGCISSHVLPHSGSDRKWTEDSPWAAQSGQYSAKTGSPLLGFVQ